MATITVISDRNIASNLPGVPGLPFGTPVEVDSDDEYIQQLLAGGVLTEAPATSPQDWSPEGGTIHTLAATELPTAGDTTGSHPGGDQTASSDDVTIPDGDPSEEWTRPQLHQYAVNQGLDVNKTATKTELLDAINGGG